MSVTIYKKDDGTPIIFAHMIDAKESVAGGFYVWNAPPSKVAQEEPPKVEEKKAPAKEKVEHAMKKEKEPVVEKEPEPVIEKEDEVEKPIRKINPRIIRK